MPHEANELTGTDLVLERSRIKSVQDVEIGVPTPEDAAGIHALISSCPPLDTNSLYANLIQCTHFAETCAFARLDGQVVGWVSGHRPPGRGDTFFLWQVAVHPSARGMKLPRRMIVDILKRSAQSNVQKIETSITRSNDASWGLFRSVAAWLGAPLTERPWFDRERHFGGLHATEHLVTIGPFSVAATAL